MHEIGHNPAQFILNDVLAIQVTLKCVKIFYVYLVEADYNT